MWKKYFRFKLVPGVMIHPRFGRIDFRRDDLDAGMLRQIVDEGAYYLELTPEGQKEFYGVELPREEHVNTTLPKVRKKKSVL